MFMCYDYSDFLPVNFKFITMLLCVIDNELVEREETVELLGVKIDERLNFNDHNITILKKEIESYMR